MKKKFLVKIVWFHRVIENEFYSDSNREGWLSGILEKGFYDYLSHDVEVWYPPSAIMKVEKKTLA